MNPGSDELIGFPGIYRSTSSGHGANPSAQSNQGYNYSSFSAVNGIRRDGASQALPDNSNAAQQVNYQQSSNFGRRYYTGQVSPNQTQIPQTNASTIAGRRPQTTTPIAPSTLPSINWNASAAKFQAQKAGPDYSSLKNNYTSPFDRTSNSLYGLDPLGVSAIVLDDAEPMLKEDLAASIHNADLEIEALREEVIRLNHVLDAPRHGGKEDYPTNVDPAVEQAYQTMAKTLEERDKTVVQLTFKVEAMMAAVVRRLPTSRSGIKSGNLVQNYDIEVLAHRLLTRINMLKDENTLLNVSTGENVITKSNTNFLEPGGPRPRQTMGCGDQHAEGRECKTPKEH